MAERIFAATQDQLEPVQQFIASELAKYNCDRKVLFQLAVAVEEIFINIAHYAYRPEQEGTAKIRCSVEGESPQVTIQFLDNGKPFNPLAKEDADITLSAEERQIGGLGILMVKKSMDAVDYAYENGSNILTIKKKIQSGEKGHGGQGAP